MKSKDMGVLADGVVATLKRALEPVQQRCADLEQRLAAHERTAANREALNRELEARLSTLEAKPFLKDAGVWRHGSVYHVGDVATFKGSAWSCTVAHTADGPVADHAYWRLLMKGAGR